MWQSKDKQGCVFSFYHVGPRDGDSGYGRQQVVTWQEAPGRFFYKFYRVGLYIEICNLSEWMIIYCAKYKLKLSFFQESWERYMGSFGERKKKGKCN